jgi:phage-related minor tail protein
MAEGNRVMAQTNAVLKSTGGVAGVTAQQVDELANSLLRKTGIDDEAIQSAENMLLTFTNVRNVVGDQGNIFDQATTAALDMSTAMGTDLQSAALRVGKALQDPIRGSTALRRVGVLLTKQQEAQIATLVKNGR